MAFDYVRATFNALARPECTLTAPQRLVLVTIADHINTKQKHAWPSQQRLTEVTSLSRATLNRALIALEEAGFVTRQWRGGHRSTLYRINLKRLGAISVVSQGDSCCLTVTQQEGTVVSQWDTIKEKNQNTGMEPGKESKAALDPSSAITTGSTTVKMPKGLSVAEIVKQSKSEYADLTDDQIVDVKKVNGSFTGEALKTVWRRAHGKYVKEFCPELTLAQVSQLVQANKKVQGALPILILLACKNWTAFVKQAEKENGAFKMPAKPSIPHFVKHVSAAMTLAQKVEEPAHQPAPAKPKKSVQLIAQPETLPSPVPALDSTKLTVADIEDLEI